MIILNINIWGTNQTTIGSVHTYLHLYVLSFVRKSFFARMHLQSYLTNVMQKDTRTYRFRWFWPLNDMGWFENRAFITFAIQMTILGEKNTIFRSKKALNFHCRKPRELRTRLANSYRGVWTGAEVAEVFHEMTLVVPYLRDLGHLVKWLGLTFSGNSRILNMEVPDPKKKRPPCFWAMVQGIYPPNMAKHMVQ